MDLNGSRERISDHRNSRALNCASKNTESVISAEVVGAGVGAPLVVLLIVALGNALWYRRKWIKLRDGGPFSFQSIPAAPGVAGL